MNTERTCANFAIGLWFILFGAWPINAIPAEGFMGNMSGLLNGLVRLVGMIFVGVVIVAMLRNMRLVAHKS